MDILENGSALKSHAIRSIMVPRRLELPLLSHGPIKTLHYSEIHYYTKFYNVGLCSVLLCQVMQIRSHMHRDYKNNLAHVHDYNTHIQRG